MPISVYSIQVRGRDMGGQHRCANKEEAQSIYDQLTKAVNGSDEFFEITLGTTQTTARKSNIAGFSISVHLEETPEERKARAIEEVERNMGYGNPCVDAGYAQKSQGLIGGGLF